MSGHLVHNSKLISQFWTPFQFQKLVKLYTWYFSSETRLTPVNLLNQNHPRRITQMNHPQ